LEQIIDQYSLIVQCTLGHNSPIQEVLLKAQTISIPNYFSNAAQVFEVFEKTKSKYFCQDTLHKGKAIIGLESIEEIRINSAHNNQLNELIILQEKYKNIFPDEAAVIGVVNYEYAHSLEEIAPLDDQTVARLVVYQHYLIVEENEIRIYSLSNITDIVNELNQFKRKYKNIESKFSQICSDLGPDSFNKKVNHVLEEIRLGNLFQCVISETFKIQDNIDTHQLFQTLYLNESVPYLYYFKNEEIELLGASPETFITIKDNKITSFPIAGTRPRKSDPLEDRKAAAELENCPKENAEHLMLVDLARNDLGRVSKQIEVEQYKKLTSYKKVHHLVSKVTGILNERKTVTDAFNSCFPAGTLSGAPKIQAMKTINQIENNLRGPYGGCVLHYHFNDYFDSFIVIRSLLVQNQTYTFRAGAGIVYDSIPQHEYKEIQNKAKAIKEAL